MAKNKDLILEDYQDDDYEFDYDYGRDNSDFVEEYEEEKYANYESKVKENKDNKKKSGTKEIVLGEVASTFISSLMSISNIFGIIGAVIAIVLILIFIFTLQFKSLLLYLLLLIVSFLFGYGFMFFLDYFTSNN